MKIFLRYIFICALFIPVAAKAQFENFKDSVVQLYGVVMTADSLQALRCVTVVEKQQGRGTFPNSKGLYSWPLGAGKLVLEQTHDLSNPAWTQATSKPTTVLSRMQIVESASDKSRFYRLRSQ